MSNRNRNIGAARAARAAAITATAPAAAEAPLPPLTNEEMNSVIVTLELPVMAVNVILNALGAKPYAEVAVVIGMIKQQGDRAVDDWRMTQAAKAAGERTPPPSLADVAAKMGG